MTHLTIQQLVAQTDGELSGPSLTLVEKHVGECEACWHELELLAEQDALLASVVAIDPGEEFFEDLAATVEAEISGKKKPVPRPGARPAESRPAPAPPPVLVRPQPAPASAPPEPEPEPVAEVRESLPEPVSAAAPADPAPAPEPVAAGRPRERAPVIRVEPPGPAPTLELLAVGEPLTPDDAPPPATSARVNPELVETWTPPKPTPDDPFADLVLPRRASPKPAPPAPAPRPPEPRAPRSEPAPERKPPATSAATPAPERRPQAAPPPPPAPARKPLAAPAASPAPRDPGPPVEPYEPRRRPPMAAILIGVGAFIAGVAVAILVAMRVTGIAPWHGSSPPRSEPVVAPIESSPPVAAASEPAPERPPAEPPPAVEVKVPPAVLPEPVHAGTPAPTKTKPRAPRHTPAAAPSAEDGAALNAPSTTVIPVHVIHTETVVPASPPPAPAPAPATPAARAELGVLCGTVLDTDSHPVARAQVMMADVGVVVLTDRTGHFCLTAPAGERTLSVVALGFTSMRRLVSLGKSTPELSVKLMPAAPFPTPH